MATLPKRPVKSRVRAPLLMILGPSLLVAVASILFLRKHPNAAPTATQPEPSAAIQPDVAPARILPKNHIYSETSDPKEDIAAALKLAKQQHKRVILDFGGDWCGDCQVLDLYFHQPQNDLLLAQNFVLVHVFIGRMDRNLDIPRKYNVPVNKGVPALAVLDAMGNVVFSQTTGEFEKMRDMDPTTVSDFLNRWKA